MVVKFVFSSSKFDYKIDLVNAHDVSARQMFSFKQMSGTYWFRIAECTNSECAIADPDCEKFSNR